MGRGGELVGRMRCGMMEKEREREGGTGMGNAVVEWDEGRREGE